MKGYRHSKDGRLSIDYKPGQYPKVVIEAQYVVILDGESEVFRSNRLSIAESYVAGYDLARSES